MCYCWFLMLLFFVCLFFAVVKWHYVLEKTNTKMCLLNSQNVSIFIPISYYLVSQ